MRPPRILPPHYFVAAMVIMVGMSVLPASPLLPTGWPLLGLAPVAAGVAVAVWGSRLFAAAGTNIVPFTESTALVTGGAFALSRNPMYLGMVLTLAGIALVLNTLLPRLVVALFAVLMRYGFIRIEERLMQQTFADAYDDYCRRVRRWL